MNGDFTCDAASRLQQLQPRRPHHRKLSSKSMNDEFQLQCPVPLRDHPTVQMAHGGGGRFMRQLIESMFLPAFAEFSPGTCAG